MSVALVFLFLIGTAAIVWAACFVGCGFAPTAQASDYYQYQGTLAGTSGLVAFWPLNDASGTTATALGPTPGGDYSQFNGTYTVGPVTTYDGTNLSDASPGTFTLNQPNIVPGDSGSGSPTLPGLSPSTNFYGGFVSVPWLAALNPPAPGQFTLEAWVVPLWSADEAATNQAYRAVVASAADQSGTLSGFSLLATPDNYWAAAIGIGTTDLFAKAGNNQPIVQNNPYFLVATYDGTTLTLWVNPIDTSQMPDGINPNASGYVPTPSPVPLFIGMGRPDLPTGRYPFNGFIQDVAFYNVVLDKATIEKHYMNGMSVQMG